MSRFQKLTDVTPPLKALHTYLESIKAPHYKLLLCRGASLRALGLMVHTSQGDDVVPFVSLQGHTTDPIPMPWHLVSGVARVAREFDLSPQWLMQAKCKGPCAKAPRIMPSGFTERLTAEKIGEHLTVYWLSRQDMIHLKLFSAVDRLSSKYARELDELHPTPGELNAASRWARSMEPSGAFQRMLDLFMGEFERHTLWH